MMIGPLLLCKRLFMAKSALARVSLCLLDPLAAVESLRCRISALVRYQTRPKTFCRLVWIFVFVVNVVKRIE